MTHESSMIPSDFPSTEAIDAAASVCGARGWVKRVIAAAVEAQPVVALPPCPTCEGEGTIGAGAPTVEGYDCDRKPCPSCKGSGLDRLIPASEIRAFINGALKDSRGDRHLSALEYRRWLDERVRSNGDDV